ncbi:sugar phosphate isomerase/epimerase [Jiangella ureilytica]|uniref:Sugar phosphate isomerase/epimerase n=1 Tax=Jiangella ureilytica TaxID=2530374 RepID=A0A4R4RL33_9ACTN|nr:sugar phosphate isomerase/epimerase family protein [Jiangella ureilytica]TDC50371.1 sugar phosphate isomerase/epimerase [Jiangella ureilytica]
MAGQQGVGRRAFLRTATAATAATAAVAAGVWPAVAAADEVADRARGRRIPRTWIGQQWFMIRTALNQDFEGTWAAVADLGITKVELGPSLFGRTPAELRDLFDSLGLRVVSRMLSLPIIRTGFDTALEESRALGVRYLRCNVLPEADRRSLAALRQVARDFNVAGEAARDAGFVFGHHNHDMEFRPVEGVTPMEVLLSDTDPRLVDLQLDVYWAQFAGVDVVEFMTTNAKRIGTLHLKDMVSGGAQTDIGSGIIDWPAIFDAARRLGVRNYIFDLDNPPDPMASVKASYEYLTALRF